MVLVFDLLIVQQPQEAARLVVPQLCVELVVGDEFGVAALFYDMTFVKYDQPIHRCDGG